MDGRRIARRALLGAGLAGGAGIAALPLLTLTDHAPLTRKRPRSPGDGLPFNAGWLFGGMYQPGAEAAGYDDSGFTPITLPHTALGAELSWRTWDPGRWEQVWIYRRHFAGSSLVAGSRVFADFDGVMVGATVVCNGRVVTTHRGGYLPFSAELTGLLGRGDNVLAVIVDGRCLPVPPIGADAGPASIDFLQPGGIYRDVRLRMVPQVFISDLFAMPSDVLTAQPQVNVQCAIDARQPGREQKETNGPATLLIELLDGEDRIASKPVTIGTGAALSTASAGLTGFGPARLWSPDSPTLYTVRATLTVPGIGEHVATRRIGFRDATFRPDGFYLNGQRLHLFGLNRHQMFPYTGMAMPARVQRRDAEILRNDFNCNMVRCSHYPQSPHFLDACDELGLMVWEEAPGWGHLSPAVAWRDMVVQNVRDMVTRDRSRPSVIIWGTRLNETHGDPALWAATRQAARELDPSRPSSGAMDVHRVAGWAEDVFGFDDYSVTGRGDAALAPPLPGVPYLVTEAVGVVETRPHHVTWTDPPHALVRQAALHAQAHSAAMAPRPQAQAGPPGSGYAGLLAWAGFDYHSLQGHPDAVKWAGVADGFRIPKPGAAIYRAQVAPEVRPVIIPVFFWEPGGPSPAAPPAMIASNCDRLQITVGGGPAVTALPASDSPLYGNLPYPPFLVQLPAGPETLAPPDLVIRGYTGGKQVAEVRMSADTTRDRLAVSADDDTITADGSDATRVVFRAVDAYGNQRRYFAGQVTLTLSGPGTLIGDNPFDFGGYGGLGAMWVRSIAGQPGAITVSAEHPALGQAEVQLRASRGLTS